MDDMPLFYFSQVTAYLRFPAGADRIWVTMISSFASTYYRSLGVIVPGAIVESLFKGLSGGMLAMGGGEEGGYYDPETPVYASSLRPELLDQNHPPSSALELTIV